MRHSPFDAKFMLRLIEIMTRWHCGNPLDAELSLLNKMKRNYLIRWTNTHSHSPNKIWITSSQIENAFHRTLFQLRFVHENWNNDFIARLHDVPSSIGVNTFSIHKLVVELRARALKSAQQINQWNMQASNSTIVIIVGDV